MPMLHGSRFLLLALAATAALALAQEEEPAPQQEAGDEAPDSGEGGFDRDTDEDVFVPTEEIPADVEVTFPVDI